MPKKSKLNEMIDALQKRVETYDAKLANLESRVVATMERRRATALMPDDDAAFALWTHERDRGDKLRRALINWLSRPF